eukprot:798298_1
MSSSSKTNQVRSEPPSNTTDDPQTKTKARSKESRIKPHVHHEQTSATKTNATNQEPTNKPHVHHEQTSATKTNATNQEPTNKPHVHHEQKTETQSSAQYTAQCAVIQNVYRNRKIGQKTISVTPLWQKILCKSRGEHSKLMN